MAGTLGLSRDDAVRIHSCLQTAAQDANKHVRTVVEYAGKKFRVVVYEERDVQAIAQERATF
jgi:hypothetical protein